MRKLSRVKGKVREREKVLFTSVGKQEYFHLKIFVEEKQ
jgi:hypothetical protein